MLGSLQTMIVGVASLSLIVANGFLVADRNGSDGPSLSAGPLPAQVRSAKVSFEVDMTVRVDFSAFAGFGQRTTVTTDLDYSPGVPEGYHQGMPDGGEFGYTPNMPDGSTAELTVDGPDLSQMFSEPIEAEMSARVEGTVVFPDRMHLRGAFRFKTNAKDLPFPVEVPDHLNFQIIVIGQDAWMTAEGLDGWVHADAGEPPQMRFAPGKIQQRLTRLFGHPVQRTDVKGQKGARIGRFEPVLAKPGSLSEMVKSGGELWMWVGLDDGYPRSLSLDFDITENELPFSVKSRVRAVMSDFSADAPPIKRPSKIISPEAAKDQLGIPLL
jgi:hypothetical protein